MKSKLKCINTKIKSINDKKTGSKTNNKKANSTCSKTKTKKPFEKLSRDRQISIMKTNINKNGKKLWIPKITDEMEKQDTISWFKHKVYTNDKAEFVETFKKKPSVKKFKKCLTVRLFLTRYQKILIKNWLNACTIVYNNAVDILNTKKYDNCTPKEMLYGVREDLFEIKKNIQIKSVKILNEVPDIECSFTKKHSVKIHILDYSIKEACKNYSACITKIKNKQIKHFELKHLAFDRSNKVLKLEKRAFSENAFYENIFGKINGKYNRKKFKFDDVKNVYNSDCTLKLDCNTNRYYLFVPCNVNVVAERKQIEKDNKKNETIPKKMISLDPGLRTFMTGITENSVEKICYNYSKIIKPMIKKEQFLANKLKSFNDPSVIEKMSAIKCTCKTSKKKQKGTPRCKCINKSRASTKNKLGAIRRRIKNKINDMQWKTISYLTKNHENIYIGDLSTKNVVKNGKSNLNGSTKQLLLRTNLYLFRERLKYKCAIRGVNYQMINEYYTSKMCSSCGEINEKLSSKKVFECEKCKVELDRDVNGARNIYLKKYIK